MRPSLACGVTWIPEAVAESWAADPVASHGHALASVAERLRADFAFVPADVAWGASAVGLLHARGISAVWAVDGPVGREVAANGWSALAARSARDPADALERCRVRVAETLADVHRGMSAGVDAVLIADDLFDGGHPLYDQRFIESIVTTAMRASAEATRGVVDLLFHSDGDPRVLAPVLRACGIAGVHVAPRDHEAFVPIAREFATCGIAPMGGAAVRDTERSADVCGNASVIATCGGALCDDGGISSCEDLEHLAAVFRAVRAKC